MTSPVALTPLTSADVAPLAQLHLDAFPGSESTLLGERYARAFVSWFARQPDAITVVAHAGAAPIGYVFGAPAAQLPLLYRSLLPVVLRCVLTRPWVAMHREVRAMARQRARLLFTGAAPHVPFDARVILKTIAVAANWRGRGVGAQLLAAFSAAARERGAQSAALHVLMHNRAARSLYERNGWYPSGPAGGEFIEYATAIPASQLLTTDCTDVMDSHVSNRGDGTSKSHPINRFNPRNPL